ncbi:MAG: glycosyltransferase [Streptosporangiales bacterium]|nr:glycosyltransferase [Streptosporangiales bacterium]
MGVVLPCLNEEAALPWVLQRMPAGYRAIVADNGSTDRSPDVARELGADVVTVPQRGYGAACHAGVVECPYDVVCVMDADASLDPTELSAVAAPVLAGDADLVLGRRRAARGAFPLHARLANRALGAVVSRHAGARLHDLGPMRAFRRSKLLDLGLVDRRFGYPLELVVRAAQADWRIDEVPVSYLPRAGRSKVTGTVRGTLRTVHDMSRVLAW